MPALTIAPPRTWEELAAEVQSRTDRQVYPMTGMRPDDVREILASIKSLDRDEWGRAWSAMGERWTAQGKAKEKSDRAGAADDHIMAWRYFAFGAWPTQNAPEKQKAYDRCVAAFESYGRLQTPAIETLRIPFEGKEIVGYLQLPESPRPAPVVLTIGGLDSYKEYTAERYGPVYMAHRMGYVALDAPGTGHAPLKADVDSERFYSAVIDYLLTRPDVDPDRIGLQGVSFGGYWATKVAYAEPGRLKCVVNWAGPTDAFFKRDWQAKAFGTREYLFDMAPAMFRVYGASDIEDYLLRAARMSVRDQGLTERPAPPMLLVNGERDTVAPIEDLYVILRNGPTPKTAWVNPVGWHLASSAEWNDERIMREVIVRWLADHLRPG
jgi:esterase FrsA